MSGTAYGLKLWSGTASKVWNWCLELPLVWDCGQNLSLKSEINVRAILCFRSDTWLVRNYEKVWKWVEELFPKSKKISGTVLDLKLRLVYAYSKKLGDVFRSGSILKPENVQNSVCFEVRKVWTSGTVMRSWTVPSADTEVMNCAKRWYWSHELCLALILKSWTVPSADTEVINCA